MTLVMEGRTKCRICGEPLMIDPDRPITAVAGSLVNMRDPLAAIQGAVHVDCLQKHPLFERARRLGEQVSRFREHMQARSLRCPGCGEAIGRGTLGLFHTNLVTSDPESPLWDLNYVPVHMACFERWEHAATLLAHCRSSEWEGPALLLTPHVQWDPDWAPPGGVMGKPRTGGVFAKRR